MILYSHEKTFQEDILHFIISHKWKEKKANLPLFINLLSLRAHSNNSDFD